MMAASETVHMLVHEGLCVSLFYTVFCRSVSTSDKVKVGVRFAFFTLGGAALMGVVAPLAWGYTPNPLTTALLVAIVHVQATTSRYWVNGVPEHFVQEKFRTRRRRSSDAAEGVDKQAPVLAQGNGPTPLGRQ